ncbi:hypothetical protein BLNAU_20259 [Blattamonas nauphoetae]|uniref:CSC1/OSCA1-like cytosolic domain-containing protein n=1 Tax=Blattamonas nauphoetae TaxID=2049346 RepID=A0ABQ9WZF0_9EUKA|nr:hypothetical protein BLNAU_20259 [Blattamonas nauphoetae]
MSHSPGSSPPTPIQSPFFPRFSNSTHPQPKSSQTPIRIGLRHVILSDGSVIYPINGFVSFHFAHKNLEVKFGIPKPQDSQSQSFQTETQPPSPKDNLQTTSETPSRKELKHYKLLFRSHIVETCRAIHVDRNSKIERDFWFSDLQTRRRGKKDEQALVEFEKSSSMTSRKTDIYIALIPSKRVDIQEVTPNPRTSDKTVQTNLERIPPFNRPGFAEKFIFRVDEEFSHSYGFAIPMPIERTWWEKLQISRKYKDQSRIIHQIRFSKHGKRSFWQIINSDIETLGLGPGLVLYFKLERYLAILFLFLSIASVISTVLYVFAYPGWRGFNDFLTWTSLGNSVRAYWEGQYDIVYQTLMIIPELLFCVIFCIGIYYLKPRLKAKEEEVDDGYLSVGDYSVFVQHIPDDIKEASVIADHFSQYGEIYSVLLCYNVNKFASNQKEIDNSCLMYYDASVADTAVKEEDLMMKHDLYVSPQQRMIDFTQVYPDQGCCVSPLLRTLGIRKDRIYHFKHLKDLGEQRLKWRNPIERPTTGVAFIIFMRALDANKCAVDYSNKLKVNLFGGSKSLPTEMQLQGGLLRVQTDIEPNDVLFSNLGYSAGSRLCRELCTNLVAFVFVAIGVGLTFLLHFWSAASSHILLTLLISLITTILSSGIFIIVHSFSPFTRPITRTDESKNMIVRMWVADFALSSLASFILSIFSGSDLYYDTDRTLGFTKYFMSFMWFKEIGTNLFTNILVDVAKVLALEGTQIIDRILQFLPFIFAGCCRQKFKQDELNHYSQPIHFRIEKRMAHIIKLLLSSLLVSCYQPLASVVLFIYFTLMYWIDKFNLIYFFETPPSYSPQLIKPFLNSVFHAVHLHCILFIIIQVFVTVINGMHRTVKYWYLPVLVFGVVYGPYLIFRFFWWLKKGNKKGLVSAKVTHKVDMSDETEGKPFSAFIQVVQTYEENHPLYREPDPANSVWLPDNVTRVREIERAKRQIRHKKLKEYKKLKQKMQKIKREQAFGDWSDSESSTSSESSSSSSSSSDVPFASLNSVFVDQTGSRATSMEPLPYFEYYSYYCVKVNRGIKRKRTLIPVFKSRSYAKKMEKKMLEEENQRLLQTEGDDEMALSALRDAGITTESFEVEDEENQGGLRGTTQPHDEKASKYRQDDQESYEMGGYRGTPIKSEYD